MFRIVNRLIQWTGKYKRRIYSGFVYAFIHSIFTAIPIMLAAQGLGAVLDDFNGVEPLAGRDIWIILGANGCRWAFSAKTIRANCLQRPRPISRLWKCLP